MPFTNFNISSPTKVLKLSVYNLTEHMWVAQEMTWQLGIT